VIDVCLVGTGGTMPIPGRALASALVRVGPEMILFDCGEGTQVAMRAPGWGFGGLSTICLTHVHADHIAGLPGLLLTLGTSGRTAPVRIFGARFTAEVVEALRILAPRLPYAVEVRELRGGESFPIAGGTMRTLALRHHVPCLAYRLDVARGRRFQPERARELGVPLDLWRQLQDGKTADWPGGRAVPDDVLGPPRPGLALAYVTDTRPVDTLPEFVRGVDLLICESTYLAPGDEERAAEHDHMHLSETCQIAAAGQVRRLWLTHFSPAVPDPAAHADEAVALCPIAEIGRDGMTTTLAFRDE
jgi:ribonuclease Z